MVLALVEELLRRGYDTCLVTDAGSEAERVAASLGARVESLAFFSPLTATRDVARTLDRLEPDLIHAHGSRAGYHVARWLGRAPERPAHYTVHGYHFHHRAWPRRWIGRWAERRTGPVFPSVVHVCEHDRRLAEKWRLSSPDGASRVIYNGVAIDTLPPPASEKLPRVAFVGRLVPQKDPRLIAGIAKRLAAADVPVTIVGGGPFEAEVRRTLRSETACEQVEMVGEISREQALIELARASLLVLPSRWEGFPVVLLEALAIGVPVVAAAVGGVPEIVTHGKTGVLVGERSPAAFAEAATRLLAEPETRRRFETAGRERVRERFTLETFLEESFALYGV